MFATGGISGVSNTSSYGPVREVTNQGLGSEARTSGESGASTRDGSSRSDGTKPAGSGSGTSSGTGTATDVLTFQEQQEVRKLKGRDQEVRAHEQAHMAAGGQYIRGGATYSYQTGPDGNRYAVGGEVSIDTSPVSGDPAATIRKMETVKRAALAPANPSGQDRRVAASAESAASKARWEEMAKVVAAVETTGNSGRTGKATGNTIDTVA